MVPAPRSIPIRSCIACRNRENWTELLHLVEIDGQVIPDPDRKLDGRGAWLHRRCFDVAVQRRSFSRAFKSEKDLSTEKLEQFLSESH
jgi:predicted RNA-binding protein YlxR (DUF448 family)